MQLSTRSAIADSNVWCDAETLDETRVGLERCDRLDDLDVVYHSMSSNSLDVEAENSAVLLDCSRHSLTEAHGVLRTDVDDDLDVLGTFGGCDVSKNLIDGLFDALPIVSGLDASTSNRPRYFAVLDRHASRVAPLRHLHRRTLDASRSSRSRHSPSPWLGGLFSRGFPRWRCA